MSLQINDTSLGITVKKACVRIDYHVVNPGTPIIERAPSTFDKEKILDDQGKPMIDEKGKELTREIETLGEVISVTKTYNVNLFLQFLNEEMEGVYHRECVSINGILEKDLNFKTYYTRLKENEKFSDAENI